MTVKAPNQFDLTGGEVILQASSGEKSLRKFQIDAYSGGIMRPPSFPLPVVVDISGVTVTQKGRPVLADHGENLKAAVGHTTLIDLTDTITAQGIFSGGNEATREVIQQLDNGMPLQASVGMRIPAHALVEVKAGENVRVNGRDFVGPILVAQRSELKEISFCPLGADDNTGAKLLAASAQKTGEPIVAKLKGFDAWCDERGIDVKNISDEKITKLQASFSSETKQASSVTEPEGNEGGEIVLEATAAVSEYRQRVAAESARHSAILKLCASADNPQIEIDGEEVSLQAHAINEGWGEDKTALYVERATRPKAPAIHVQQKDTSDVVLEASLVAQACAGDQAFVESQYDEKTLEAAYSPRNRGFGIQRLMHEMILRAGASVHPGAKGPELMSAFKEHVLHASSAFTTNSVPGILSNVANKRAMQAFKSIPTTYQQITSSASMNDFKEHTGYRLTPNMKFRKVGKDGELKHAKLHEESYTNQLDTYGGIIQLTRQDIINDDLSMFSQIPGAIGREAAATVEQAVYETLLGAGSNFFASTTKKNLKTSNALSYDGLSAAEQLFTDQTKVDGRPVMLTPSILLVPTSLKALADRYMQSTSLNETTSADTPAGETNIHAGKFKVISSPYMNSQALTGSSATDWYLLADPLQEGAIEVGFLNGVDTPTVESEDASFEVLGTRWRYYFDFGVAEREYRAAVKCTA